MTKAERTRHFIIEKAAPLINRKGMAGTSINDIMEATRLTKGSVYGNFENKEEICAEAFDYLIKRITSSLDMAMGGKKTYKEKLFAFIDYYPSTLTQDGYFGCPMLNFGTEADDTNPIIKQKVSKAINATEASIAKLVQAGIKSGEFSKTVDAEAFALKAFAMIEGGMWIARMQNSNKQILLINDMLKKEIAQFTQ
jgi:TetR/AcrR family transcriptional repressor of nem operon